MRDWFKLIVKGILVGVAGIAGIEGSVWVVLSFLPKRPPSLPLTPPGHYFVVEPVTRDCTLQDASGSKVETDLELVEGSSSDIVKNDGFTVETECRDLETIGNPISLSASSPSSPTKADKARGHSLWEWGKRFLKVIGRAAMKGIFWFLPKRPISSPSPGQNSTSIPKLQTGSESKVETELELVEGSSSDIVKNDGFAVEAPATECRDLETIGKPISLSASTSSPTKIVAEALATAEQGQSETEAKNETDRLYSVELLYWRQQRSVFVEVQYHLSKSQDRTGKLESRLAEHLEQGSSEETVHEIRTALSRNQQKTKALEDQLYLLAKELLQLEADHPDVKAKAIEETERAMKDKTLDEAIARVSEEIADLERRNPHFKQRSKKAKTTSRGRVKGSSSGAPRNLDIGALPAPGPSGSGTRRITSGEQTKGESHAAGPGDIEIRPDQ